MPAFFGSPGEALGIMVDGLEVKLAHLLKEKGKVFLLGIENVELKTPLVEKAEEEERAKEEDILGLKDAEVEREAGPEEEAETNTSVLYSLLSRFPVRRASIAFSMLEPAVQFFDFESDFGLKGNKLKQRLRAEILETKGIDFPFEQIDSFKLADGRLLAAGHEKPSELLNILGTLKPYLGVALKIAHIDTNETALIGLARKAGLAEGEVSAVVYVGREFSRVVFMRGWDYLAFSPALNEGFQSPGVLNTVFSRILLAQDESGIPEINRFLLAGESQVVGAEEFFKEKFPEARVSYLVPEALDLSRLESERVGLTSAYAIPISLAWRALEPSSPDFLALDFLPEKIREEQKVLKLAWHGFVVIGLIVVAIALLALQNNGREMRKSSLQSSIQQARAQIAQLEVTAAKVDSLDAEVQRLASAIAVTDSLSKGSERWSSFLKSLSENARKVNSIWVEKFAGSGGDVMISGSSLYINRVTRLAKLIPGSEIPKISEERLRDQTLVKFDIRAKPFGK